MPKRFYQLTYARAGQLPVVALISRLWFPSIVVDTLSCRQCIDRYRVLTVSFGYFIDILVKIFELLRYFVRIIKKYSDTINMLFCFYKYK